MIGDLHRHILKTLSQGDLAEGEFMPNDETVERAVEIVTPVWHTRPEITTIYDGDVLFIWTHGTRRGVLAVLSDGRHYWTASHREGEEIFGDIFEWGPEEASLIANVAWVMAETEESEKAVIIEPERPKWWQRLWKRGRHVKVDDPHSWDVADVES